MIGLLKRPEEWTDNHEGTYFHNFLPEYTIEFSEVERFKEPYTYYYTADNGHNGKATFRYRETVLFSLEYMTLDDGRSHYKFSEPSIKGVYINGKHNIFYYYDLSDEKGIFLTFLTQGTYSFSGRYHSDTAPFLLFNDKDEFTNFEAYLEKNQNKLEEFHADEAAEIVMNRMKKDNFTRPGDPIFLDKVKQLYSKWKTNATKYNETSSLTNIKTTELIKQQVLNVREPKIEVTINSQDKLSLSFTKNVKFQPLVVQQPIDKHQYSSYLSQGVTLEKIERYNKRLPSSEEIEAYNNLLKKIAILETNGIPISIDISNVGNCKANDISIFITFPKETKVVDLSKLEELKNIEEPFFPQNPLETVGTISPYQELMYMHEHNSHESISLINSRMRSLRKNTVPSLKENVISLQLNSLLHKRNTNFSNMFLICPYKAGVFQIHVSCICEELQEEQKSEIEVEVVEVDKK